MHLYSLIEAFYPTLADDEQDPVTWLQLLRGFIFGQVEPALQNYIWGSDEETQIKNTVFLSRLTYLSEENAAFGLANQGVSGIIGVERMAGISSSGTGAAVNVDGSCEHYQRGCNVGFEGSEAFSRCHRCANEGNKKAGAPTKLKAKDATKIQCRGCKHVHTLSGNGRPKQYCPHCKRKWCDYFCRKCNQYTNEESNPYHCEKCGICRVDRDRSFHCDTCGVCLDNKLQNNHRCREGSAHDECCICLEDAFTGCQLLPCSHKVHKECAKLMIRNGITRCPVCKESFAHKLERRPKGQDDSKSGQKPGNNE